MELWIRSQDKTALIKTEDIRLYFIEEDEETEIWLKDREVFIGKYKNKNRALEVLDEIHKRITLLNAMSTVHDAESFEKLCKAIGDESLIGLAAPYQMPEN